MQEFIGNAGKVQKQDIPMPEQVAPVESGLEISEEVFKKSLKQLDMLAVLFEQQGTKLANRKKKSNMRVLKAILFETEETEKTFGKDEKFMLDICRDIMYHRQIIEIFLMREESNKLRKDLSDERK